MGIITTGSFARALWPGINQWFQDYAKLELQEEWKHLFDESKSTKAYEKDVGFVGTGLAPVKTEGGAVAYDTMQAGFEATYTHTAYALGFIITREEFDDVQYPELGKRRTEALRFSMRQTKENVCANIYNRAFNASYSGADGVSLVSNAHPFKMTGGTWSNTPTTQADISEAALEQAVIDIRHFTDERGLRLAFKAESLIIPPESMFIAARILKSVGQNNTANNAINALRELGIFPKGVQVNTYLTNTTSWYVRTNVPEALRFFDRQSLEFDVDNDSDTKNAKYMAYERYSAGWSDPRGLYASQG